MLCDNEFASLQSESVSMAVTSQGRDLRCIAVFVCVAMISVAVGPLWAAPPQDADAVPPAEASVPQPPALPAQPASPSPQEPGKSEAPKAESLLAPSQGDVVYLPNPNGTSERMLVPVLHDVRLNRFLEWLRTQGQAEPAASPDYSITAVTLEGSADDEFALLTAHVTIQVNREDRAVLIPLQMGEATLREPPRHEGPGTAYPSQPDRDSGYRWWLEGKGRHVLSFPLSIPVRKSPPDRRFQLALPTTPVSSLKLRVPMPRISVKAPERSTVKTRPRDDAESEIELYGIGPLLDLSWRPLPDIKRAVETQLQTTTWIAAELTTDSVVLEAHQMIGAVQGSFQEVTVRMPQGFSQFDISEMASEASGRVIEGFEQDSADPSNVRITFQEPVTGSISLKWTLYAEYAELPERDAVSLDRAFEIVSPSARRQTGYLAIGTVDDYRVSKQDGSDRFVHRVNVSELRSVAELRRLIREEQIASGYRFVKQPFHLVLDLEKINPYFTAKPNLYMRFTEDRAELEAVFEFDVFQGAIRQLDFSWPRWELQSWGEIELQEGWKIAASERTPRTDELDNVTDATRNTLRVQSIQPVTQSFTFRLRAWRPITPGEEPIDISLPTVQASSSSPATVVLASPEKIRTEIVPTGATAFRAAPDSADEDNGLPPEFRALNRQRYRIDSTSQTFLTKVTVHKQEIHTETAVETRLQRNQFVVVQRVNYDVRYEPLSQVRLVVPNSLADRLVLTFDGQPLNLEWTGGDTESTRRARCLLPTPQIGRFDVIAEFRLDLPEELLPGREFTLPVPLVASSDAEFTRMQLEIANGRNVAVAPVGEGWTQQFTSEGSLWKSDAGYDDLMLQVSHSTTQPSLDFSVTKAAIRTVLHGAGPSQSSAQFRIQGNPVTVVVAIPQEIELNEIRWNGVTLDDHQFAEVPVGSGEYRIDLSEFSSGATNLLTVMFRSAATRTFTWSDTHRLSAPQFPPGIRVGQTIWEVVLPWEQHLFTCPANYTAEFQWQRSLIFWHRVPYAEYARLDEWIGADDGWDKPLQFAHGNKYQFGCFGQPRPMTFQTMSQPAIVLLGAGLALALGWILLKIPATRNMLTILILGFTLAVIGLWYSEPVELLLQSAILGLLLAIAAAAIEGAVNRRRGPTIVTLSSPSDYYTPSSSSVERASLPIGSEDPTAHRPAPGSKSPVASSSEASSRHE